MLVASINLRETGHGSTREGRDRTKTPYEFHAGHAATHRSVQSPVAIRRALVINVKVPVLLETVVF